jgi:hypothetical protein
LKETSDGHKRPTSFAGWGYSKAVRISCQEERPLLSSRLERFFWPPERQNSDGSRFAAAKETV